MYVWCMSLSFFEISVPGTLAAQRVGPALQNRICHPNCSWAVLAAHNRSKPAWWTRMDAGRPSAAREPHRKRLRRRCGRFG